MVVERTEAEEGEEEESDDDNELLASASALCASSPFRARLPPFVPLTPTPPIVLSDSAAATAAAEKRKERSGQRQRKGINNTHNYNYYYSALSGDSADKSVCPTFICVMCLKKAYRRRRRRWSVRPGTPLYCR